MPFLIHGFILPFKQNFVQQTYQKGALTAQWNVSCSFSCYFIRVPQKILIHLQVFSEEKSQQSAGTGDVRILLYFILPNHSLTIK